MTAIQPLEQARRQRGPGGRRTSEASLRYFERLAALHLMVSNRFQPGLAGSVSPVMQSCLCVLEVAGVPFEELARRAWQSSLGAAALGTVR